jgi:hypothetical protein
MGYNVFADMGLPNPEMELLKCEIVHSLRKLMEEKDLTPQDVSALWSIPAEGIPLLLKGDWEAYSVERLFQFAGALNNNICIVDDSPEAALSDQTKTFALTA